MTEKTEIALALEGAYEPELHFRFSTEGISAQKSLLFEELTLAIENLRVQRSKDRAALESLLLDLQKIMQHHTGINIKLVSRPGQDAYVMVNVLSGQNALTNNRFVHFEDSERASIARAVKATKGLGSVDFKKSRVSGVFAEIETTMVIGSDFFFTERQTTSAETAAIILHELGHVFTIFTSIIYTATTNFALSGVSERLNKAKNTEEIAVIVKDFAMEAKLDGKTVENLVGISREAKTKDAIVVQLSLATRNMRPELGIGVPDQAQCEHMADEFAAMHGAGYDLARALDKWREFLVVNPVQLYLQDLSLIFAIVSVLTSPIHSVLLGALMIWAAYIDLARDRNYGTFHDRIRKIRSSMIERMKGLDMKPAELAAAVLEIDKIENIVEELPEYKMLFTYVFEFIFKGARDRRAMIVLQNNLEQIASNDLFVSAARLKTSFGK